MNARLESQIAMGSVALMEGNGCGGGNLGDDARCAKGPGTPRMASGALPATRVADLVSARRRRRQLDVPHLHRVIRQLLLENPPAAEQARLHGALGHAEDLGDLR